jgi:uncharacterized protein involved in outer membrane biogenesis
VARRFGRYAAWTGLVLVLALVVFLLIFDWNWLKGPIEGAVSRATGRTLVIEGDLSGQWRLTPRLRMERVRLSNPEWARAPQLIEAEAIELRIALLPLLVKRIHVRELHLQQPQVNLQRTDDGRATWLFDREQDKDDGEDGNPPIIDTLSVDQGVLNYLDDTLPAALTATVEDRADPQDARSLKFTVEGKVMGEPVKLEGETASLLSLRDVDRTVPLLVRGIFANTKVAIEGELDGLAAPGEGRIRYEVSGPSLSLLESAFRVPLPETPRYAISGLLVRKGDRWETTDLKGKVGESDVAGTVAVETGGEIPSLEANLRSSLLDLADLGPLIGGTNRSRLKPNEKEADRLLPARAFEPASFRKLNAHVILQADRIVRVAAWPFDDFRVDFRMNEGRILLDPVRFGMAGGTLQGRVEFDASEPPIRSMVSARMDNVDVSRIAPDQETLGKAAGTLSGRMDLRGRGNSIGGMLGSADGRLTVLLSNGNVPSLLPAIVDLDGARVLAKLLGAEPESVRCSAIDIAVADGVATPKVAVVETDTTVLTLSGQVNLESEAMDLKLTQAPKKPSFLSVRTPILVQGTLLSPDLAPAPAPLAARAAAAALLALVNPLASVFALIETGPGEDGTCPVIQRGYTSKPPAAAANKQ